MADSKARIEVQDNGTRVIYDAEGQERAFFASDCDQKPVDDALANYSLTDAEWIAEVYRLAPILWLYMGGSNARTPFPIYHPYLHMPHGSRNKSPSRLRDHYEWKESQKRKYLAEKEWRQYIFGVIERPYRAQALLDIAAQMPDRAYWETFADVYTDSESTNYDKRIWKRLFESCRPGREFFMRDNDREIFASLPNQIKVYRGYHPPTQISTDIHYLSNKKGRSWSLFYDIALKFTYRIHGLGMGEPKSEFVREKTVRKSDVLGFINSRNEREIVLVKPQ